MKRLVAISFLLLFAAALALCHGNEQHVIGVVSAVTQDSITVETLQKQTVTVKLGPETKFEKASGTATLNDVKAGERVVIHAVKDGDQLKAHTVRIGIASAAGGHDDKSH